MRCTCSARFTTWNHIANARSRSRASAGGRSRTHAASSARASREPPRPRMAATRSSSTSSNSCSPPCSRRISPTIAPSACTSSRSGSCLGGKWMSLRFTSVVPAVCPGGEVRALRAHEAETLPGRRLHHAPGLHHADAAGAESLEAARLGLDVVGFDVQVHAARVRHLLYFDVHLIGCGVERAVQRVGGCPGLDRQPERRTPEARGRLQIVGTTVDDESGEAALVHEAYSFPWGCDWLRCAPGKISILAV